MIEIPKELVFSAPNLHIYSDSKASVLDVARRLEKRYGILKKFYISKKAKISTIIQKEIIKSIKSGKKINSERLNGQIQALFRQYIYSEEHGILTKASRDRGGIAFIDEGNYVGKMRFEVIF